MNEKTVDLILNPNTSEKVLRSCIPVWGDDLAFYEDDYFNLKKTDGKPEGFIQKVDRYLQALEKLCHVDYERVKEATFANFTGEGALPTDSLNRYFTTHRVPNNNSIGYFGSGAYASLDFVTYYALINAEKYPLYSSIIKEFNSQLISIYSNNKVTRYNQTPIFENEDVIVYPHIEKLSISSYISEPSNMKFRICSKKYNFTLYISLDYMSLNLAGSEGFYIDWFGNQYQRENGILIRLESPICQGSEQIVNLREFLDAGFGAIIKMITYNVIRVPSSELRYEDGQLLVKRSECESIYAKDLYNGKTEKKIIYFISPYEGEENSVEKGIIDGVFRDLKFDRRKEIPVVKSSPNETLDDAHYGKVSVYTKKIMIHRDY